MLQVAPGWVVPRDDLEFRFVRSSGPGGQNVNKLATKVELRFRLDATRALNVGQKRRLRETFPSHVTQEGDFLLSGDRFRSQRGNQRDVEERLVEMLLGIRYAPKPRVATKPSRTAKRRRVAEKRARSDVKRQRRQPLDG
jgi:ribosome-associated protein